MAVEIVELGLRRYQAGQYCEFYLYDQFTVSQGVGNESKVVKVCVQNAITCHYTNSSLLESLSSEADIIAETALWVTVGVSTDAEASVVNPGFKYLKIINDNVGASVFNISGM